MALRPLTAADTHSLEQALLTQFYGEDYAAFLKTEAGQTDLRGHLTHRVTEFTNNVVPWLRSCLDLQSARVLEIGTGTGASVAALADASRHVVGIDIMASHLAVAQKRLDLHGVCNATLHVLNATEIGSLDRSFDLILYAATLEHMTIAERLSSLASAWTMLAPGGLIGIYETPNRLWFRDDHTSLMPFLHWLPDDLACLYAARSPRAEFAAENTLDTTRLYRWGRGASFHEIDLAIGLDRAELMPSLHQHMCGRFPHYREVWDASKAKRYHDLLGELMPGLAGAWREELLGLLLRKR